MKKLGAIAAVLAADTFAVRDPAASNGSTCGVTYFDDLADVGDDLDLADVGWNPFRRRRKAPARRAAARAPSAARMPTRAVPAARLLPQIPGVPARGLGEQPLGFGATAFTATSGTLLTLTASPQRPFRGRRLIIDITRTGASATGLVTVTRLDVGVDNQLPGSGSIAAASFAANAVGVNLDLDPATPGVNVTLQLNISAAPTMTDRVDVAATLIGETVR